MNTKAKLRIVKIGDRYIVVAFIYGKHGTYFTWTCGSTASLALHSMATDLDYMMEE